MIPENDNVFDLKDFLGITDAGMTVAVHAMRECSWPFW
jgi:hypothetical protein